MKLKNVTLGALVGAILKIFNAIVFALLNVGAISIDWDYDKQRYFYCAMNCIDGFSYLTFAIFFCVLYNKQK